MYLNLIYVYLVAGRVPPMVGKSYSIWQFTRIIRRGCRRREAEGKQSTRNRNTFRCQVSENKY